MVAGARPRIAWEAASLAVVPPPTTDGARKVVVAASTPSTSIASPPVATGTGDVVTTLIDRATGESTREMVATSGPCDLCTTGEEGGTGGEETLAAPEGGAGEGGRATPSRGAKRDDGGDLSKKVNDPVDPHMLKQRVPINLLLSTMSLSTSTITFDVSGRPVGMPEDLPVTAMNSDRTVRYPRPKVLRMSGPNPSLATSPALG